MRLAPGEHVPTLACTQVDENMDRRVNTALLDHARLTLLAPGRGGGRRRVPVSIAPRG